MHLVNNGYVSGAVLLLPTIRKLREHIEFEKFQCRVLVDNELTKSFKIKTATHEDQIHALRYNNENSEKLTAAGRKTDANKQ